MLPRMNQPVDLSDDQGLDFHAVVLIDFDDSVILLKPVTASEDTAPFFSRFTMRWTTDEALVSVPVRVTEGVLPGFDRPIWEVTPEGDHEHIQRRSNRRLPMSRTMQITNFLVDQSTAEEAQLLDISESGLRCSLPNLDWLRVPLGTNTRVRFSLIEDGEEFIADAGVAQVRAHPYRGQIVAQVVTMFRVRELWTERLRRAISGEEVRRAELDERRQKIRQGANGAATTRRLRRPLS